MLFIVSVNYCFLATPITVTVTPTNVRVREGQEAVIMCRSTGPNNPPLVRWTYGDQVKIY